MADPLDVDFGDNGNDDPLGTPVTTGRAILIAALVALVVGCIPALATALVVNSSLKGGQDAIVQGRVQQTLDGCAHQNTIVHQQNRQTDFLASIIITSTQQSRAFENTYRKLGLPPYKVRIAQARKQAKGLTDRKLKETNCAALAATVAKQK